MAEKSGRKYLVYLFFFAAGLLGTMLFVLLARRMLRCVLAYGLMNLAVVLLIALLCGVGVGLAAFLSEEVKRVASSLYFGAALVLVGFIVVATLAPGPPEEACLAFMPEVAAPKPVIPRATAPWAVPTPTMPPSPEVGRFLSPLETPSPTGEPGPTSTSPDTDVAPGGPPSPTCGPPADWVRYAVCPGDTMYGLAKWFLVTTAELGWANCLTNDMIYAGQVLWVPSWPKAPTCQPMQAATAVSLTVSPGPPPASLPRSVVPTAAHYPTCGPPTHWVRYVVCPGDTMYGLAQWFRVATSQLGWANCLANDVIYVGQVLWVPSWPPAPPCAPVATATPERPTVTPVSPTSTPGS